MSNHDQNRHIRGGGCAQLCLVSEVQIQPPFMLLDFPRLTLISFVSIRQPDQPPRGWHLHNRHEEDRNDTAHIIRCARQRLPHLPLPNPADEYVALILLVQFTTISLFFGVLGMTTHFPNAKSAYFNPPKKTGLYSFRNPLSKPDMYRPTVKLRTVAVRTFIGACCTLASSIV